MRRLAKALILFLVFAALPLRGYAGVVMALCESHHGGAAEMSQAGHHAGGHDHDATAGDAHEQDSDPLATVCSLCSACSSGMTFAPDGGQHIAIVPPGAAPVPFIDRRVVSHTPDNPDRPPLVLSL